MLKIPDWVGGRAERHYVLRSAKWDLVMGRNMIVKIQKNSSFSFVVMRCQKSANLNAQKNCKYLGGEGGGIIKRYHKKVQILICFQKKCKSLWVGI